MDKDAISTGNLLEIAFLTMLSPGVRMIPRLSAAAAGGGAWLSILPAAVVGVFLTLELLWIQRSTGTGKGMPDLILMAFGSHAGGYLLILCGMWYAFYCGFVINTSAERLISTVYIEDGKVLFVGACGIAGFLASNRGLKGLGRFSRMVGPGILAVIAITAVLGIENVKTEWAAPGQDTDIKSLLRAAVPIIDCMTLIPMLGYLKGGGTSEFQTKDVLKTVLKTIICFGVLSYVTIGALSAPVTAKLENPFFVMVRDIKAADIIERIDAVVVGIWVLTDYMIVSLMLTVSSTLLGRAAKTDRTKMITAFSAGIALLVAFGLPEEEGIRRNLSDRFVPLCFGIVSVIIPSVTLLVNRRKQSIYSVKK